MASGSAWSVGGYGAMQVIRVLSNPVLALLLFREDFGLMAMVLVVASALELLSDVGLHASVVQDRRADDAYFLNNIWTLQIIRGFLLWGVGAAAAYPVMLYFGEPRLMELIPIAAAACAINGFMSTKLAWHQRHLRYAANTSVEIISRLIAVACTILLAWLLRDVLALVYGMLIGALAKTLLSHVMLDGPANRLAWHLPTVLSVLRFGRWLAVSTFFTFFAQHLDKVLLGRLETLAVLGVYHIGAMVAKLPATLNARLSSAVLFPAFSQHHRAEPETLVEKVRLTRRVVLLGNVFVMLGLVLLAPVFFQALYQAEYHDAVWVTQLVAVSVWIRNLQVSSVRALLSRGITWVFAATNGVSAVMTLILSLLGYHFFAVPGFVIGIGLGAFCGYLVVQYAMVRERMSMWRQDLRFTALLAVLVVIGLLGQWAVSGLAEGGAALAISFGVAVVVLGVYGVWATGMVLTILFGPDWAGLWRRLEQFAGGRVAWAVPRRYRGS